MDKIEKIKNETIVVDYTYKTTDGKEYKTLGKAEHEQKIIDGIRKGCIDCKNKGFTSHEKQVIDPNYPTNLPDSGWITIQKTVREDCVKCKGKGYLELGWN